MYKIKTGQAPDYLCKIVLPEVGEATRYSLRNNRDIQQFNCRLSIMKTSFSPSTIDEWNNLPIDIRNLTSLLSFKRKLNSLSPQTCPQKYYKNGQRQASVTIVADFCPEFHPPFLWGSKHQTRNDFSYQ